MWGEWACAQALCQRVGRGDGARPEGTIQAVAALHGILCKWHLPFRVKACNAQASWYPLAHVHIRTRQRPRPRTQRGTHTPSYLRLEALVHGAAGLRLQRVLLVLLHNVLHLALGLGERGGRRAGKQQECNEGTSRAGLSNG